MLKVVWLCPYQLTLLKPEISFTEKFNGRACSWIYNLSNELSKIKNIDVHIITFSSKIEKDLIVRKNRITFYILKYTFPLTKNKGFPSYFPLDKITWYMGLNKKFLKLINKLQPHIIHAHGTESVYGLLTAKLKGSFPTILSIQGIIEEVRKINSKKFDLQIPIEKYSIKNNQNFGCRTEWDIEQVLKRNPDACIFYMPEAINTIFFRNMWNKNNLLNEITYVGTLSKDKGIHILLDAFTKVVNEFPKVRLNLIGKGYFYNHLSEYIDDALIASNVCMHGYLSPEEIVVQLMRSNVFVLPSFMENSPNSLMEAMAVGVPCTASNVGGIPSLVDHGNDGFLVEKGNSNELAKVMSKILKNKELQKHLSKNAKKKAFARNFPSNVAKKTIKTYNTIIENYNYCYLKNPTNSSTIL